MTHATTQPMAQLERSEAELKLNELECCQAAIMLHHAMGALTAAAGFLIVGTTAWQGDVVVSGQDPACPLLTIRCERSPLETEHGWALLAQDTGPDGHAEGAPRLLLAQSTLPAVLGVAFNLLRR